MGSHTDSSPCPPSVACLQCGQLHCSFSLGHLNPGAPEADRLLPESQLMNSPTSSASLSPPGLYLLTWGPVLQDLSTSPSHPLAGGTVLSEVHPGLVPGPK